MKVTPSPEICKTCLNCDADARCEVYTAMPSVCYALALTQAETSRARMPAWTHQKDTQKAYRYRQLTPTQSPATMTPAG